MYTVLYTLQSLFAYFQTVHIYDKLLLLEKPNK